MQHEIGLFWAIVAGLLVFDNLVLVPSGADHLRFGLRGKLRYEARSRLQILGRDLVFLNPVNTFDRMVLTQRVIGRVSPAQWRAGLRSIKSGLTAANQLSAYGAGYLLSLIFLAVASTKVHFGTVLLALAVCHLSSWVLASWIVLRRKDALGLGGGRAASLCFEALVVPGYLVNLGKRVWGKRQLDLAGFTCGLRQLKGMDDEDALELYRMRMAARLSEVEAAFGGRAEEGGQASVSPGSATDTDRWFEQARTCLKTSAP